MATCANFTTSTTAPIADREALESIIDEYTFEGDVELTIDDSKVRIRGSDGLYPHRSADDPAVPIEFLAELVTVIDSPMKIQVVGNTRTRFPFRGQQYRLEPETGVYLRTLDADEELIAEPGQPLR